CRSVCDDVDGQGPEVHSAGEGQVRRGDRLNGTALTAQPPNGAKSRTPPIPTPANPEPRQSQKALIPNGETPKNDERSFAVGSCGRRDRRSLGSASFGIGA